MTPFGTLLAQRGPRTPPIWASLSDIEGSDDLDIGIPDPQSGVPTPDATPFGTPFGDHNDTIKEYIRRPWSPYPYTINGVPSVYRDTIPYTI